MSVSPDPVAADVERALASWINANGIDAHLNRPDYELAREAMEHHGVSIERDAKHPLGYATERPSVLEVLDRPR